MATQRAIAEAFYLARRTYPDYAEKHLAVADESTALMKVWGMAFEDIPDDLLGAAVADHVTNSQWWPKPSELRERAHALQRRVSGELSALEAWGIVKASYRAGGMLAWEAAPEVVRRALDCLGGRQAFGQSELDDEPSWRARYVEAYNTLLKREREDREQHPLVRAVADRLRIGAGTQTKQLEGAR